MFHVCAARLKRARGQEISIFAHRNEAGVETDDSPVNKIHSERENGPGARWAPCLSRLTLKFKVTFRYGVGAVLPNSTAASVLPLPFSSHSCWCCLPAPPPPLCCHGNTHTEQSGRLTPRARCRGCCSDCRCTSQRPQA